MIPVSNGISVYKKPQEKKYDKNHLKQLNFIRQTFNNSFEDIGFNWKVKKSFIIKEIVNQEDIASSIISDFIFFPIGKLVQVNGQDKQDIGVRLRLIKHTWKKKVFKRMEIDLSYEQLQGTDWLNNKNISKEFKTDLLKKHYNRFLEVLKVVEEKILADKPKILITNQIGWILGSKRWHYVPITDSDDKELIYDKQLAKKMDIKYNSELSPQETFGRVLNMLDLKGSGVDTALFSYTITSLFTSLMDYSSKNNQKFMICLYGDKTNRNRFEYANLLCNLFNRRKNISSLNENFHSNLNCSEDEFRLKAFKIRDAIFIVNVEGNPRKINMAKKLLSRNDCENMLLLLNDEPIDQDFVLNLNADNINRGIFENVKNDPSLLTTFLSDFVHFHRHYFSLEGNTKKLIAKMFSKIHKNNQKFLEDHSSMLELNKVNYFSNLLIGFSFFLDYGLKIMAIDELTCEQNLKRAVEIFREMCVIPNLLQKTENKNIDIHIIFLQNLLNLLEVNTLTNYSEKNNPSVDNENNLGWKENDEIFHLRNNIFDTIDKLLDSGGNSKLKFPKANIYYKLFENEIVLPREEVIPDKPLVKYFEYSINVTSSKPTVRVFKFNKKQAVEYITKVQGIN